MKFQKGDICVWSAKALNIPFEQNNPDHHLEVLGPAPVLAGTQMYVVRIQETGERSNRTEWALIKVGTKGGDVE